MQKTRLSTPPKGVSVKYFKYEMKDTNQLLRDLISCNMSDTVSRSGENKQQIHPHDIFRQSTCLRKIENTASIQIKKKNSAKKSNENQLTVKQMQKPYLKYQQQLYNFESQVFKDLINESAFLQKRKNHQSPMEDLILQKIFMDYSEAQDNQQPQKLSFQKYKNKDLQTNTYQKFEQNKDSKKQKKGLANISLRVKNIVSQHKKLTYKQVSDLVLQYSKDEIDQLNQSQKIRQIKNIKRRVYDALNVLVAVGILGKHQRCVCITQWTNVPGKKLSNNWQKINSKIEYINKLKKDCVDKQRILQLHIEKYNAVTALRKKHEQEENNLKITNCVDSNNLKSKQNKNVGQNSQQNYMDKKIIFPVVVFFPGSNQDPNDKLKIQMEHEQTYDEQDNMQKQKMKISGKDIMILGDFQCVCQLNLQKYRDKSKEQQLLKEIDQCAQQTLKKRTAHFKHSLTDDYQQNIQDYFNEQMFESN